MRDSTLGRSLLAALAACAVSGASARAYDVVAASDGGTITGKVVFRDTPPHAKKVIPTKNSDVCGGMREEAEIALGEGGSVQNAVVYLKAVKAGKAWNDASKHALLDNKGCEYIPRVQALPVGGTLEIVNSDPLLHNVHGFKGADTIFNNAMWKDKKAEKVMDAPGLVKLDCDVHGWMRAWVYVAENPYFAMTAKDGSFTIADVPPGDYTLVSWQEYTGAVEMPVTVKAKETATVTSELKKQETPVAGATPQAGVGG